MELLSLRMDNHEQLPNRFRPQALPECVRLYLLIVHCLLARQKSMFQVEPNHQLISWLSYFSSNTCLATAFSGSITISFSAFALAASILLAIRASYEMR